MSSLKNPYSTLLAMALFAVVSKLFIFTANRTSEEGPKRSQLNFSRNRLIETFEPLPHLDISKLSIPNKYHCKTCDDCTNRVPQPRGRFPLARANVSIPFYIFVYPFKYDTARWGICTKGHYYEYSLTRMANWVVRLPLRGIVVDAGANIGWVTLLCAAAGRKVVAFEPTSLTSMLLNDSIRINGLEDRVVLHNKALSNREETLHFLSRGMRPGSNRVYSNFTELNKLTNTVNRYTQVKSVVLDEYVDEAVLFLKIDVEGHEWETLQGAKQLLQQHKVAYIHIELNPIENEFTEILRFLFEKKYHICGIERKRRDYSGVIEELPGVEERVEYYSFLKHYKKSINFFLKHRDMESPPRELLMRL